MAVDEAPGTTGTQGGGPRGAASALRWVVPAAAGAAVLVRLLLLTTPAAADEAGFLVIGGEWSGPGTSLYGDYWVDRPPLLLMLFRVADLLGGLVALRLLGCLAVVVTVLASARAARLLVGPRAAAWTAVVTAALLSSPTVQAQQVNGELLAAPFVALGILAMVAALDREPPRAWLLAAASGAAAAAAVLVKQNIVDVLVFDALLLCTTVAVGRVAARRAVQVAAAVAAGATATVVVVALWALAHGTAPAGVLEAMYTFRIEAMAVIAGGEEDTATRAYPLLWAWVVSGLALALLLLLARAFATRSPVLVALAGVGLVDLVSVGLGGSFWLHYLIQPAVTLGLAVGLLVGERDVAALLRGPMLRDRALPAAAPLVAGLVVVSSVVALASWAPRQLLSADPVPVRVGQAVAEVAAPGDTLTAPYGRTQVNFTSGLPSPYPYLWSLPARVRDPGLRDFTALLRSRSRPTWLVLGPETSTWGSSLSLGAVLHQHYAPVASRSGLTVYLRRDAERLDPPV